VLFFSFIHAAHVFDKMLTWILININIMGFVVPYLFALKLLFFFYDFVFLNFLFCVVFLLIFFLVNDIFFIILSYWISFKELDTHYVVYWYSFTSYSVAYTNEINTRTLYHQWGVETLAAVYERGLIWIYHDCLAHLKFNSLQFDEFLSLLLPLIS
jgi:hypothetical protein